MSIVVNHALIDCESEKPFPCGCDIAWLVRQPDLINNTVGGMCENGLVFRQLKLADFAHC